MPLSLTRIVQTKKIIGGASRELVSLWKLIFLSLSLCDTHFKFPAIKQCPVVILAYPNILTCLMQKMEF